MVVIAIVAVLGAVGITTINAITGRPAQQCGQKIVYSLERHRMTAMSKVSASYSIEVDDSTGKVVCVERISNGGTTTTSRVEIGSAQVSVSYKLEGSGAPADAVSVSSGHPLTLEFERSTGAFKRQADGTYCTKIYAKSGGRTVVVTLVPLTGKVYID
ncbi:MAG: hypothetical protein IJ833_04545 [Lachnospiraceae bacterium]|nr:hypothetical protein [Lachnospiraceae bacterium]